ncbi:MFS transporter [Streptomyces lienomycini]|uniref:MFS transporter n=1 Tax=Streptomyces lienomycini TaxID=284035 RepID=A0ABV9WMQ3_9ACTN|nr:MFS transporter [Streptomyces lienomycini]
MTSSRRRTERLGPLLTRLGRPVPAAVLLAAALHTTWMLLLANGGGDLAAQDAWTAFAANHPDSAYNFAWFGGMHPASYSVLSPYVMHLLGVRTTMAVSGTVSAALLALLLVRSRGVRRPLWPALYGAFALTCNAVSGRATFALGTMFGLAALLVVFGDDSSGAATSRRPHRVAALLPAALLAALATMASPVAGLFVGIVAGALWLTRRRAVAYALGVAPLAVVGLTSWLFPFSGEMPINGWTAALSLLCGLAPLAFVPAHWRTVRVAGVLYAGAVLGAWLIPSQVGSNITRLGMLFAGVVFLAALPGIRLPRPAALRTTARKRVALMAAICAATVWQGTGAVADAVRTAPTEAWSEDLEPLLHQLERVEVRKKGRLEVVPAGSHREASALPEYAHLARGWNRQADLGRNPVFYDGTLTADSYRAWLDRWAVHYVVLPSGPLDSAGGQEARLIRQGLPYLKQVWSDANWKMYAVRKPTPLAEPNATLADAAQDHVTVTVDRAGPVRLRVPYSPWLVLVDSRGHRIEGTDAAEGTGGPARTGGCLKKEEQETDGGGPQDTWTVLLAPRAGTYRIEADYALPRGTPCPEESGTG